MRVFFVSVSKPERQYPMANTPKQENPNVSERLVLLAKSGDEAAFTELTRAYSPLIKSMVGKFSEGFPEAERDDLKQEANIAFWSALTHFDPKRGIGFGHFAKQCIQHRLIDYRRKYQKDPIRNSLPLEQTDGNQPAEDPGLRLIEDEAYRSLAEKIQSLLSPYEYQIWSLFLLGYSAQTIADTVGESRKSVENAVARFRKKLRNSLPRS